MAADPKLVNTKTTKEAIDEVFDEPLDSDIDEAPEEDFEEKMKQLDKIWGPKVKDPEQIRLDKIWMDELIPAVKKNDQEAINTLKSRGIGIDVLNSDGSTALYIMSLLRNLPAVLFALENGANPNLAYIRKPEKRSRTIGEIIYESLTSLSDSTSSAQILEMLFIFNLSPNFNFQNKIEEIKKRIQPLQQMKENHDAIFTGRKLKIQSCLENFENRIPEIQKLSGKAESEKVEYLERFCELCRLEDPKTLEEALTSLDDFAGPEQKIIFILQRVVGKIQERLEYSAPEKDLLYLKILRELDKLHSEYEFNVSVPQKIIVAQKSIEEDKSVFFQKYDVEIQAIIKNAPLKAIIIDYLKFDIYRTILSARVAEGRCLNFNMESAVQDPKPLLLSHSARAVTESPASSAYFVVPVDNKKEEVGPNKTV